jgi:hypothetical protein
MVCVKRRTAALSRTRSEFGFLFCARLECFKHSLKQPSTWWGAGYCIPVFVDPIRFSFKGPTGRLRHGHFQLRGAPSNGLQSALISGGQRYKAERLLGPRDRSQHLCRAHHWARLSQEHYLDAGAPNQRFRQTEQSAGRGEDLQPARHAVTTLEAKHGWRAFGSSDAWSSTSERWGRASHRLKGQYRLCPALHRDYERVCTDEVTPRTDLAYSRTNNARRGKRNCPAASSITLTWQV